MVSMLLEFRKAKNIRLACFLRFSQDSQHLACLDQSIQTRKTIRYFFIIKRLRLYVAMYLALLHYF